jgi:hypothetical protein
MLLMNILQALLAAITAQTLQSPISMTVSIPTAQPLTYQGNVAVHADQFLIEIPGMQAAYDGNSLYMYISESDELTISNPTEEELTQANPIRYAQAIMPLCNIAERQTAGNNETILTLTPKDQSSPLLAGLQTLTLKIRNEDTMPIYLEIKDDHSTTLMRFLAPQYTTDSTSFTLSEDNFPDAYINDLR